MAKASLVAAAPPRLRIGDSPIDRIGLFSELPLQPGTPLGRLTGELITRREARRRAKGLERICIVELDHRSAIDVSHSASLLRYMNHSCAPNVALRIAGKYVLFRVIAPVSAGDELTCDYGATHHDGARPCRCGSDHCRGML